MLHALSSPSQHSIRLIAAARQLADRLCPSSRIGRDDLNAAMVDAFGCSAASGAWTQRDSFVAAEIATILRSRETALPEEGAACLMALDALASLLPIQTVRSEEQIAHQHFSTPLSLAWLAARMAMIGPDDSVLEPSAGTGMLAHWAGEGRALHLNELDPVRAEILRQLFLTASVTTHDAAAIRQLGIRPSVVLMNPPFARNAAGKDDPLAAARHIAAALAALRPGGRLVAIMPDGFSGQGRKAEVFARALQGSTVAAHFRIEDAFRSHGTRVAIRLLAIDKVPGNLNTTVVQRPKLGDLLAFVTAMPPRAVCPADDVCATASVPIPERGGQGKSLFKAFGRRASAPVSVPVADRCPSADAPNWVDVQWKPVAAHGPDVATTDVYAAWRPQRIAFEGAADHPAALVESAAMASVLPPLPAYVPRLPRSVMENQVLSAAQLETVTHALDATSRDLPGRYAVPEKGLELVPHAEGQIYRQGFFLGDGTGAGKGRQLAGILMDQWLRGNRRHIWLSENASLQVDAIRDWEALGGMALDIQSMAKFRPDARITLSEGILFLSYATLRNASGGKTRLQQLLEWCGPDFEGCILFDEAHAMGGVAGGEGRFGATKGSLQGLAGVELQNRLPRARVVYASATGATDINNLAYAVRLGLWGEGTQFPDRTSFTARIREGGIAAMELVARELKAMGVYTARSLSYAGVEYDILEHALTPVQIADFDAWSEAWSVIHRNMESALAASGVTDPLEGRTLNGPALAAARSRFQSSVQRFFGQLLLAMKLPTLLPAIQSALDNGMSAVVQLVSTSEALLDRRLADLDAQERAELAIDLSPRELCLSYLQNAFPTRAMESYVDEDGNMFSRPISDADGHPVHCADALRLRDDMIEMLGALPPIAPALDAIITRFGADAVAEVTGRTRRLLTLPDGSQKLQSRSAAAGVADANLFMAGSKRILVFSDAGGTGRSYHASLAAANQQRRVHFLLEPGWRADKAIQGLGRTNRTHQASAPIFRPVTTDCRGERRFISTIARRLDALGALTRGQRQTGGQNLFDPADNLESEYAREALLQWYRLLHAGKLTSCQFASFCERTGLRLEHEGSLVDNLPPIQRWLNRILALPIALQNAIFDEFLGLVEARIEAARKAGTFDAGVETVVADRLTVAERRTLLERDGAAITELLTIEAQWAVRCPDIAGIMERARRAGGSARFLRNGRSGKVALLVRTRSRLTDDGLSISCYALHRPGGRSVITDPDLAESHWDDLSAESFARLWQAECADLEARPQTERFFLATGRLLPIWNLLGDEAQVRRLVTQDGRSLLGRIVPAGTVNALLDKLGLGGAVQLTTQEIVEAALSGKVVPIDARQGLSLRRSRVNGEARLEILGFEARALPALKAKGCFTEIIQFRTRLFLPVNDADRIVGEIAA
ncbi:strawberry notch-like NTP hydrolase domain-containing protein [Novosphingobium sp. UBA1939]|uniref:strawberry notch-like NTP hydrolase domain-containing protein n=3 Tax=Pseudomonadota TaxID=1224 RepID=UPI0025D2D433|nr:strawberry notch family protein [Novosphingobium sp. UBA1939]